MLLPIDILQQIFLQLCPPDEPTYFPPGRHEPRLILAHVSSQWRAIAFAMPELWNNIHVGNQSRDDSSCLHNLLPIWLSNLNSSLSKLSFRATCLSGYDGPLVQQLIFSITHRCSVLTLELRNPTFCRLLSLPPGSFASLQTINLMALRTVGSDIKHFINNQPITAFHSSPDLRHVALQFHGSPINIARLNLPWHQLLTLTLRWCTVPADIFLDVLRECTSLRSCHVILHPIHNDALQRMIPLSGHPIVSSSLHTLNLGFSTSDHCSQFFAATRLPHLRKCEVSCSSSLSWPLSLRSFLQTLSHTLEDLTLRDHPSSPEYMDEILTLLPHLTRFSFFGDHDPPLTALNRLRDGIVAPRLTELSIGCISRGLLLDLLEGRLAAARAADGGVAAFRVVSAYWDDSMESEEEKERLMVLRATGMTIWLLEQSV